MAGLTPTIAVFDLDVNDRVTDAAALKVWIDAVAIATHIYGWAVTAISNSRFRYTIIYD